MTLPGPWGFLASGYVLGLLLMAILVHRIQHIVVRRPHRTHRDFASAPLRIALRLPSLCLLSRSLLLWSATLAHTAHRVPPNFLARWVARYDTPALCWSTFCSVCATLCIDALARGLEGASTNASPFNLFGYAFLLHIYSSPMTHTIQLHGLPPRPDKHVVFTILLPLLHLTLLHSLAIKHSWSNHRLIPSAFVSIVALLHFHWVLWFSDATYPLLNYLPCLFESVLLFLTCLAVFLNAITQILAEGALSRPLFGHHDALLPRLDEDFSVALLRMGTASLETSSVAGLGNEVGGVTLMPPPVEVTTVALSRFGVDSISHPLQHYSKGFANEIKHVKATSNDGDLWLDLAWYREFVKFSVGAARFLKRLYAISRDFLTSPRTPPPSSPITDDATDDQNDDYDRFIRGEHLSDDEYDEYEPSSHSRSSSVDSYSSLSDNTPYDHHADAVALYADLSSTIATSTSASHLLAHLADHSPSPLTRRRFSRLVSASSDPPQHNTKDGWTDVIHARRPTVLVPRSEETVDDARRNCVICTVEPRQIICWPCRCLALCDDCRENLASRSSVSKHICPCCRTNVEGYSKIYIP